MKFLSTSIANHHGCSMRILVTGPSHRTAYPGCGPQFLWREYEMTFNEGFTLASSTCLTAVSDNFVKLRIGHRKDAPVDRQDVERFILQLRKARANARGDVHRGLHGTDRVGNPISGR